MQGYTVVSLEQEPLWQSAFCPSFPLRLMPFSSFTFQDLRKIFWGCLALSPSTFFDFWLNHGLDIEQEFQKEDAGLFKEIVKSMQRTLKEWEAELRRLKILRIYKTPPASGSYKLIEVPEEAAKDVFPVHYEDKPWLTLQDMVPKMLGKYRVSVSYWYQDILFTMPHDCKKQNEWRWIIKD